MLVWLFISHLTLYLLLAGSLISFHLVLGANLLSYIAYLLNLSWFLLYEPSILGQKSCFVIRFHSFYSLFMLSNYLMKPNNLLLEVCNLLAKIRDFSLETSLDFRSTLHFGLAWLVFSLSVCFGTRGSHQINAWWDIDDLRRCEVNWLDHGNCRLLRSTSWW